VDGGFIPESVLARDVEIMASRSTDRRLSYESKEQKHDSLPEEQEQSSLPEEQKEQSSFPEEQKE